MSLQFLCAAAFARFMRQRMLGSQELACSALTYGMFENPPLPLLRRAGARGDPFWRTMNLNHILLYALPALLLHRARHIDQAG
jgi:hypothetical protein